jgi:hypothetical protein
MYKAIRLLVVLSICLLPFAQAGVSIDIRPATCPNLVDLDSRAFVPIAIVGDIDFNASRVDVTSLQLRRADGTGDAVTPLVSRRGLSGRIVDLTAPAAMGSCSTFGVDGIRDLLVRFGSQEMVQALELNAVEGDGPVTLCLSGESLRGASFEVCDDVVLTALGAPLRPFGNIATRPLR